MVACATAACVYSAYHLPLARLDLSFIFLAVVTIAFGSRLTIQIPRAKVHISVTDSLIFLTLLVYGGEAAVLLAVVEACYASLRLRKKGVFIRLDGIFFNGALMALSIFLTAVAVETCFGPETGLVERTPSQFITALCVMALVQYVINSGLAAVYTACDTNESVWATWRAHYFPASATFVAGAAIAGLLVKITGAIGISSIITATPVIFIVYLTHRRYIDDIKTSSAQVELAERGRAELAERHVEQQQCYIVELERVKTELEESKEHFRHAAFHDALTGLPNRALLTDHLKLSIEMTRRRADHHFAVLFLDLDRFKNINDSLGHAAGDRLLVEIARRLELCLRPSDTVARLGGDEFAILLNGLDSTEDAIRVAERVQQDLMHPFYLSGNEVYTTASIGITISAAYYADPENVLRDADTAMYQAKEKGKTRYELFDTGMHARAVLRLQLENDLRRAIENREFEVYYQPIVALDTCRITGFEALVRWHHPERGFVSPAEFIPLAEETGLITEIGSWVLREACRQTRRWSLDDPALAMLTISVNLSSRQFMQPDLLAQIKQILDETNLNPRRLKLEITESAVMANAEAAASMLGQLRNLGIQTSIDDFGTGYSSLSYLHRFPIDTLKIDRSFVSRMSEGDENAEIVRTIITLATNLSMSVIAEGVETAEQHERLKELDCEYGQGYLFSRPVPAAAALALVQNNDYTSRVPDAMLARTLNPTFPDIDITHEEIS